MYKLLAKTTVLLLLGMLLALQPAAAQGDEQMTGAEIDALVRQHMPEDTSLSDATNEQLEAAVKGAVSDQPQAAEQIVGRVAGQLPEKAMIIAGAAAGAAPDQGPAIAAVAVEKAPHHATAIIFAISRTAPGQTKAVQAAVEDVLARLRKHAANRAIERAPEQAERAGVAPPRREEMPASPVNP